MLFGTQRISVAIPSHYKPSEPVKHLPFSDLCRIWFNSFKPNRLKTLQDELVELVYSAEHRKNLNVTVSNKKVPVDDKGNFINEVCFEVINDSQKPTKHIVFVHGYGASLGCFARNFQLIDKFVDMNHNYKVHFLDNLSFGLSSNPKIQSSSTSINGWPIERCPPVKLDDPEPTDRQKLYNKYYKLVKSFSVEEDKFREYQQKFTPILQEIENYYLEGIDGWRQSSGIEKIDYLVGHSYGGYWSASYGVRYPNHLRNLILLSPVGVERHIHSIKHPLKFEDPNKIQPTLDPTDHNFLSRIPILPRKTVRHWYDLQPYLPRLLKLMGPWGVAKYYEMWYSKLFKINKLITKLGGPEKVFKSQIDLHYGSNRECHLIIEYLYNSITNGTVSDIYIKYLLTPSTVSKHPIFDKFNEFLKNNQWDDKFEVHFLYGQYDFMNSEAGSKLVELVNKQTQTQTAEFHTVGEGGHNLYIDNPFETNSLIHDIVKRQD
ncbi:alpha/beta-hydrolase [Yamadazyma tenuis ATCC 10573]|uniref:Alpha/beta-hydrolase n=1 Tax=Candida tenuis (strain ATCC 10573 / BCRC 21748 / CBS 615 / JCM 9827 / NBRC 10315 / NRRL Y-1498 / VKM Y-70) TaxID=590646 RepID=G3AZ26_CANTC|nr:alpha/beta-hydrolase [Yamadazyma tenuis ATCC 10573]EGV65987.1 alpha/beta-hydrolase [Yamadazyma tenuis ATCC 10573]